MKKILSFLIITTVIITTVCFTGVKAQTAFSQTTFNPTGAITNAGADTMTYSLKKSYPLVSIQPVYTRATGTAAGTMVLYYSVNGTNYYPTGDTLTLTNTASQNAVWDKQSAARYWRIITSGGTTVTATTTAKISVAQ